MTDTTTTNLESLLNALDSRDEQTRADAIRQVRSLPPDALLALSSLEVPHFKKYIRLQRDRWVLLQVGGLSVAFCAYYLVTHEFHTIPFLLQMIEFAFVLPYIVVYMNGGFQPSQARRSLTSVLEEAEDVAFVPVALTLLQDKTADILPAITELLKRLLPRLQAGDAQAWTPQQYEALLKLLPTRPKDIDLVLCVLKALEQIGDARAIPAVTALTKAPLEVGTILIRTAAQECLPYLQQRAGEQKQAQMLLRPAHSHTSGETLLRPTVSAASLTPDEQLLRPQQTSASDIQSG